jgi:cell division septal protein FtsQ
LKPTFFQRRERERYASRRVGNPYFRHRRDHGRGTRRWLLMALGGLALLLPVGGAAFALASPRFDITEVEVEGCATVDPERVRAVAQGALDERVAFVLRRRNAFLFDPARAEAAIRASFGFEEITVGRDGARLTVRVREKVAAFRWRSGEAEYLADASGSVIRALAALDEPELGEALPVFQDVNRAPVAAGETVMRAAEVAGAVAFQGALRSQGILFGPTQVDRLSGTWMSVRTAEGYDILFDPLGDAFAQADNVRVVLSTQVKDPARLRYVDVRFGDHVYFK